MQNPTVLVDKGYHNGREISQFKEANITTFVAHPDLEIKNKNGTTLKEEAVRLGYVTSEDFDGWVKLEDMVESFKQTL